MNENFFEAAIRHWVDGCILEEHEEYDNAVCMQGFAAECALKAILCKGMPGVSDVDTYVRKYGHNLDCLFQNMKMMLSSGILLIDPGCGMRLSDIHLSNVLVEKHPERRYFSDGQYSMDDAHECKECSAQYVKEMIRLYIDGYI